ncbi:MAG: hydrogenase expression/formation protein HypE [Polyangiaceae bacterium]
MANDEFIVTCPSPIGPRATVQLAHGGGGRLTRGLFEQIFLPAFDNPALAARLDAAVLELGGARLAFTTDSYVVDPLFFPGGDIGKLAVFGTVNDLAMAGARPAFLSAGFVLEEGLPLDDLRRIVASMRAAAKEAQVELVTGDTKVVGRGKADRCFVNTSGVGLVATSRPIAPARVRAGDVVVLSGDVGRHGIAVLSVRESLAFETSIESDCAPLAAVVQSVLDSGVDVHCLRDLTRGGLATALNEIAMDSGSCVEIDEAAIPVPSAVEGACELLGLDPLYVANEGRFVAFVPPEDVETAVRAMRGHAVARDAVVIGRVVEGRGSVVLRGRLGGRRWLDLLSGEQLPRIC